MPGAEVELEGVEAGYGSRLVLRGVTLAFPRGRVTAVLGPSGCGKTTLLRVVAGLVEPVRGRVLFDGEDYTRVPPERRNVGVVFQDLALFPHMTVYENIAFPLRVRGYPEAEVRRRVRWALELVGLDPGEFSGRSVASLSGGQQQRVAIARAIVYEPRVLLLDEPLSHLDLKIRQRLIEELRGIQRETGATMVYVTHDQWEAMELGDYVAIMRDGRVVQWGEPEEVYDNPVDDFVATFFGDANVLPSRLVGLGGDGRVAVVRPEDVEVTREDPGPGYIVLEAVVRDRVFQGGQVRVTLRVDGVELKALLPRRRARFAPGERVYVAIERERVRLVRRSQA